MELENGINLENLLIKRRVYKDYWLIPNKVKVRFSSITGKEHADLKIDGSVFGDQRLYTMKLLAASLTEFITIDGDKQIPADLGTSIEQKEKFIESLPTQMLAKLLELLNSFDAEVMKLFSEDSKKN